MRSCNDAGLGIIKQFEGLRLDAYEDIGGIWTIGYGHTGPDVVSGQHIAEYQADLLLISDIQKTQVFLDRCIRHPTTSNQFSACVSLAYNIGVGMFSSSTLLKLLNTGDTVSASEEFVKWDKVNGKDIPGLYLRRVKERNLFNL